MTQRPNLEKLKDVCNQCKKEFPIHKLTEYKGVKYCDECIKIVKIPVHRENLQSKKITDLEQEVAKLKTDLSNVMKIITEHKNVPNIDPKEVINKLIDNITFVSFSDIIKNFKIEYDIVMADREFRDDQKISKLKCDANRKAQSATTQQEKVFQSDRIDAIQVMKTIERNRPSIMIFYNYILKKIRNIK